MSELPEELLEEILCRVPAASLKRLRSTCKRWNRLSNDKRFTRKLLDKATKQFLIIILKKSGLCSMSINLHKIPPVELTLIHTRSSLVPIQIRRVSHCDGLLLCVSEVGSVRLVVWNPCTGQTRWIHGYEDYRYARYALGSYQDKISNDNIGYKILSEWDGHEDNKEEFRIYEINSNSWRTLDVTIDFSIRADLNCGVSLKGKTYWIAADEKEGHEEDFLLVSFDYTTEKFERLSLPRRYCSYDCCLSVVRDEKLSLLLKDEITSKTEIWVTNKIGDETKVVSWSMLFAVDLGPQFVTWYDGSFWIDEEERVLVCCDNDLLKGKYKKIHIVGEDNKVRTEDLEVGPNTFPVWLNYVPSLIQI